MSQPFTQKDLDRMGLVKGKDGVYAKPDIGNKKSQLPKDFVQIKGVSIKGRPPVNENPVMDGIKVIIATEGLYKIVGCRITLAGVISGLNGGSGLMRQHWAVAKKVKEQFVSRIAVLNPPKFPDIVRVTFTRYTIRFSDWDNMVSTGKHVFDSLVKNGVLVDDSPKYIVDFLPKQVKCRRKDQRTEILIEQL